MMNQNRRTSPSGSDQDISKALSAYVCTNEAAAATDALTMESDSKPSKPLRKRNSYEMEGSDPTPDELSKMSRPERKRHREKKRRNDVNKGFDDLMNLLIEIDPGVRAEAEEKARRGQWKGTVGGQEDNVLSRVELISRTVEVLRRIHTENEERKLIISKQASTEELINKRSMVLQTLSPLVRDSLGDHAVSQHQELGHLPLASSSHLTSALLSQQLFPNYPTNTVGRVPFPSTKLASAVMANAVGTGESTNMLSIGSLLSGSSPSLTRQYLQLLQEQDSKQMLTRQIGELQRAAGVNLLPSRNDQF